MTENVSEKLPLLYDWQNQEVRYITRMDLRLFSVESLISDFEGRLM